MCWTQFTEFPVLRTYFLLKLTGQNMVMFSPVTLSYVINMYGMKLIADLNFSKHEMSS